MTSDETVDPRLRCAIDSSIGWYEDLCALHGVASALRDGLWTALSSPPPLHSDAVIVEPRVTSDQVLTGLSGRTHCGFKDSFATLDLSTAGMTELFSASWIYRPADATPVARESGWTAMTTVDELAEWTTGHDTAAVLVPGLLDRAHFSILARRVGGRIVAGAVARLGSGTVDLSNVHAQRGFAVDWAELAAVVAGLYPGRPLVGYERGDDLAGAIDGGFEPVGDLKVWVR